MEAKVRVIASGSSGNAVFVAFGATRILIDAGVPLRLLVPALREIGERAANLSAVLVTHEHTDHICGLNALQSRCGHVPIRATSRTATSLARSEIARVDGPPLADGVPFQVGDVRVVPFAVDHDAAQPVGFRFDWGDFALGVATDLGTTRPRIEALLTGCRMLILEANHDEDMLRLGPYPAFLKRRISCASGHLSNRQSASLLAKVAGPTLEHVILAHLSRTNNTPQLAIAAVAAALDGRSDVLIEAAQPYAPGSLRTFQVAPRPLPPVAVRPPAPASKPRRAPTSEASGPRQPRLFD